MVNFRKIYNKAAYHAYRGVSVAARGVSKAASAAEKYQQYRKAKQVVPVKTVKEFTPDERKQFLLSQKNLKRSCIFRGKKYHLHIHGTVKSEIVKIKNRVVKNGNSYAIVKPQKIGSVTYYNLYIRKKVRN